jgi:arylsulfatase A-like enzyme
MAPVVVVTLEPGNVFRYVGSPYPFPIQATHGSPHPQDSHVPIIFAGGPFAPGRYGRPVRTADIAATLARVLGVMPSEPLDGIPLLDAVRRP